MVREETIRAGLFGSVVPFPLSVMVELPAGGRDKSREFWEKLKPLLAEAWEVQPVTSPELFFSSYGGDFLKWCSSMETTVTLVLPVSALSPERAGTLVRSSLSRLTLILARIPSGKKDEDDFWSGAGKVISEIREIQKRGKTDLPALRFQAEGLAPDLPRLPRLVDSAARLGVPEVIVAPLGTPGHRYVGEALNRARELGVGLDLGGREVDAGFYHRGAAHTKEAVRHPQKSHCEPRKGEAISKSLHNLLYLKMMRLLRRCTPRNDPENDKNDNYRTASEGCGYHRGEVAAGFSKTRSKTLSEVEGSEVEGSEVEGSEVKGSEVEGSEVEGSEVEGSEAEGSLREEPISQEPALKTSQKRNVKSRLRNLLIREIAPPDFVAPARLRATGGEKKACLFPWNSVYITGGGEIRACPVSRRMMGDLGRQDFSEIWNGPAYSEFRQRLLSLYPLEECRRCALRGWFTPYELTDWLWVGINDRFGVQLGTGWYEREGGLPYRWSRKEAIFKLKNSGKSKIAFIFHLPSRKLTQKVEIKVNRKKIGDFRLKKPGDSLFSFQLPPPEGEDVLIEIECENELVPHRILHNNDLRRLGVAFKGAFLEP